MMAWVHNNREEAISLIQDWLEISAMRENFIYNLKRSKGIELDDYDSRLEMILELLDSNTDHCINKENDIAEN